MIRRMIFAAMIGSIAASGAMAQQKSPRPANDVTNRAGTGTSTGSGSMSMQTGADPTATAMPSAAPVGNPAGKPSADRKGGLSADTADAKRGKSASPNRKGQAHNGHHN